MPISVNIRTLYGKFYLIYINQLIYIVLKDLSVGIGGNQNYGYSEQENSVNVRITFSVTERGANRAIIIYNSGNDLAAEIL